MRAVSFVVPAALLILAVYGVFFVAPETGSFFA